jgi:hypothetical protein
LSGEPAERLADALADLTDALERLKAEQGLQEAVSSVRDGLDNLVADIVDPFVNPRRWLEEEESP